MSSAAILICISQANSIVGIDMPQQEFPIWGLFYIAEHVGETRPWTLAIGIFTFTFLLALKQWKKRYPRPKSTEPEPSVLWKVTRLCADMSSFLGIVIGVAIAYTMDKGFGMNVVHDSGNSTLEQQAAGGSFRPIDVAVVGFVPGGLPEIVLPGLHLVHTGHGSWNTMLLTAFTTSLIGFIIVMGAALPYARQNDYAIDANQELIAMGGANIAGAFFGAFPVAASTSRTAVNVDAGACTPVSMIIAASMAFGALALITDWFYYIPYPALAAVIMVAVSGLIKPSSFIKVILQCISIFSNNIISIFSNNIIAVGMEGPSIP